MLRPSPSEARPGYQKVQLRFREGPGARTYTYLVSSDTPLAEGATVTVHTTTTDGRELSGTATVVGVGPDDYQGDLTVLTGHVLLTGEDLDQQDLYRMLIKSVEQLKRQ